jgi:hypothetical protein
MKNWNLIRRLRVQLISGAVCHTYSKRLAGLPVVSLGQMTYEERLSCEALTAKADEYKRLTGRTRTSVSSV